MNINSDDTHARKGSNVTHNDNLATKNKLPTPSEPLSQRDSQSGIDIRQALDILSSRSPHVHTQPIPPALKSMGQTINLFAPSSRFPADSPHSSPESTTETTTTTSNHGADIVTPVKQQQKIRKSLTDLPFIALLKMILTAQEDRVRTYRLYDEALGKVLVSNRLTDYPPACIAATAAFAVLSNTVSAIRDEMSDRANSMKDPLMSSSTSSSVIKCIRDLQESEREKLQLTAAYHLEKIRANNEKDKGSEVDVRELAMLNNGIADLRSRIESCRSDINSIMEDLRCALVEEMEEEEDKEEQ